MSPKIEFDFYLWRDLIAANFSAVVSSIDLVVNPQTISNLISSVRY